MVQWSVAINVHEALNETIQIAKKIDDAQMGRVWIVDFPAPRLAFVIAGKIASQTGVDIGIGLISTRLYKPRVVVNSIETLIDWYGKRFSLLIGPGDQSALNNVSKEMASPKSAATQAEESLNAILNEVTEKGLNVRVWFGAQGPRMIAASIHAHGTLLNYADRDLIEWALQQMGSRGRSHEVGVFIPSFIANEVSDPPMDFLYSAAVVALGAPTKVLLDHSMKGVIGARKILKAKGRMTTSLLESIGRETLLKWGLFGTQERLLEYSRSLESIGIDEIVFGPPMSHSQESIGNLLAAYTRAQEDKHLDQEKQQGH